MNYEREFKRKKGHINAELWKNLKECRKLHLAMTTPTPTIAQMQDDFRVIRMEKQTEQMRLDRATIEDLKDSLAQTVAARDTARAQRDKLLNALSSETKRANDLEKQVTVQSDTLETLRKSSAIGLVKECPLANGAALRAQKDGLLREDWEEIYKACERLIREDLHKPQGSSIEDLAFYYDMLLPYARSCQDMLLQMRGMINRHLFR